MALTHELKWPESPIRKFLELHVPAASCKALSKDWYQQVRAAPVACEPPTGVSLGTVGTAFDYRARASWEPIRWELTAAALGAKNTEVVGRRHLAALGAACGEEFARNVVASTAEEQLGDEGEKLLCRFCFALALYEEWWRSSSARFGSPLLELGPRATVRDLLALAPEQAVDDLASMARLLYDRCPDLLGRPAVLNPTFDGSRDIGGADADVIVERALIEFKTTARDRFERVDHLYQLLGYALLDYADSFRLEALGIYLARRGVMVCWPITELLNLVCDVVDLSDLRRAFQADVVRTAAGADLGSPQGSRLS